MRAVALNSLARMRLPLEAAEDLAHDVLLELVASIEGGAVADGREAAYVRRAAKHRAIDALRRQRGRAAVPLEVLDEEGEGEGQGSGGVENPEALLLRDEEARRLHEQLAAVRALVAAAPRRVREPLSAVYLEGRAIAELVAAELGPEERSCVASQRRVRARVDKALERARGWLRERVRLADASSVVGARARAPKRALGEGEHARGEPGALRSRGLAEPCEVPGHLQDGRRLGGDADAAVGLFVPHARQEIARDPARLRIANEERQDLGRARLGESRRGSRRETSRRRPAPRGERARARRVEPQRRCRCGTT
ncbi:MAG: sigma-70 family RNA polymerase sigma factor [Myxococcales bacterium]|nr:sigma-70 family RNA polymerase sigma factor [Myxococcales bacterium]